MAQRKKTVEPTVEEPIAVEPTVEEHQVEEIVMLGNPDTVPMEPSQEILESLGEILGQANNLSEPEPKPQPKPTILEDPRILCLFT